jgi:carboxypeptidase D
MSEVSKRKGFSPHLKRAPEPPKHKRFVNETDTYRFYTNDTARMFHSSKNHHSSRR